MPSGKAVEKANLHRNGRTLSHPESSEKPRSNPVHMEDESLVVFIHTDDFQNVGCLWLSPPSWLPDGGDRILHVAQIPWETKQLFPTELSTGSIYSPRTSHQPCSQGGEPALFSLPLEAPTSQGRLSPTRTWSTLRLPWWSRGWESAFQCRARAFDPRLGKGN